VKKAEEGPTAEAQEAASRGAHALVVPLSVVPPSDPVEVLNGVREEPVTVTSGPRTQMWMF
jgi:hypothetical protein